MYWAVGSRIISGIQCAALGYTCRGTIQTQFMDQFAAIPMAIFRSWSCFCEAHASHGNQV